MGPWKIITFQCIENVGTIVHYLKHTRHHGFPVTNEYNELQGLMLRHQLLTLLDMRVFRKGANEDAQMVDGWRQPKLADFIYPDLAISKMSFTREELDECYIDLRPYMNPSIQRVPRHASLSSIFTVSPFDCRL